MDDKPGVGIISRIEEHITARNIALLGAYREHAQGRWSQQSQCRDTLEQDNIIFDRHEKPVAR
jgi:hypothetical protein